MKAAADKKTLVVPYVYQTFAVLLGLFAFLALWRAFGIGPAGDAAAVGGLADGHVLDLVFVESLSRLFSPRIAVPLVGILFAAGSSYLLWTTGKSMAAQTPRPVIGGLVAAGFFLLNPLTVAGVVPATPYDRLSPALALALFLAVFSVTEHWSTFMRSVVGGLTFWLVLWCHPPAGLWLMLAMVPWAFFHRRPQVALVIWLTTVLLGGLLYALSGLVIHLIWMKHWQWIDLWTSARLAAAQLFLPAPTLFEAGGRVAEGMNEMAQVLSPFGFALGVWSIVSIVKQLALDRRSQYPHIVAFVGILLLVLALRGHVTMASLAVWAPLVAYQFARSPQLGTRGFMNTAVLTALITAMVIAFRVNQYGETVPNHLWPFLIAVLVAGGFAHFLKLDRGLTGRDRLRAVGAGGMSAWLFVGLFGPLVSFF
jgi:hypothetical protein